MSQTRVDSVLSLVGFPPLVPTVPPNWPSGPQSGKISLLWQSNFHELYHKFSPYTGYNYSILGGIFSNQQPFVYTYIDESNNQLISSLPSAAQSILATINVNQDTINDTVRVGKFLVSTTGITFLASQLLIQRSQPFDETRIYNPLSPLLSTVQPMSFGLLDRPTRHIETSVAGLFGAVGLGGLGGMLGISGYSTPSSTAGDGALSDYNSGQGKGLLRGGDATIGAGNFSTAFPASSGAGGIGSAIAGGIISSLKSAAAQIFGVASKQPTGTIFRADETAYGTMAISKRLNVEQMWYPNPQTKPDQPIKSSGLISTANNIISTVLSIASNPLSLIGSALSSGLGSTAGNHYSTFTRKTLTIVPGGTVFQNASKGVTGNRIKGRQTGYTINDGDKYSNVIGISKSDPLGLQHSDMLVQFATYYVTDINTHFPSKFDDKMSSNVQGISDTLEGVINGIDSVDTPYVVNTSTYSKLLSSGDTSAIGYNPLFDNVPMTKTIPNKFGVEKEYSTGTDINGQKTSNVTRLPATLDKRVNPNKNLKFATTFTSDGLNQLSVLKGQNGSSTVKFDKMPFNPSLSSMHPNWKEYDPYNDDLIAFFFYDVVNKKYIPFRATVKGISEGNTAFWDELRFLGRADQLYSYNGFSRTLSFSFNIVISSISELLPSWTKINYLASAVKPSNYTRSETVGTVYNRFIVPPMFMITIGDLYRFQPIVLRSVTVNIPEDALWETLNEYNSDEWNYLNGIITNPKMQGSRGKTQQKYGQMPREAEISIEGALLEKERAQVGGSHFGHSPRIDEWETKVDSNGDLTQDAFVIGTANTDSSIYMPKPSYLHEQMIVPNPSTEPVTK